MFKHKTSNMIKEHGKKNIAQNRAVRSIPVVDLMTLVKGLDDEEHISGDKWCPDEPAVVFLGFVTEIDEDACFLASIYRWHYAA